MPRIGKESPTIYEVARRAGVSIATVSRVLNRKSSIRESTRRKVQETIAELGYVPDPHAQRMARLSAEPRKRTGVPTRA